MLLTVPIAEKRFVLTFYVVLRFDIRKLLQRGRVSLWREIVASLFSLFFYVSFSLSLLRILLSSFTFFLNFFGAHFLLFLLKQET